MSRGASSMDGISLDDWEVLPEQASSFSLKECGNGHGGAGGDRLLLGAELVMVDMDHFAAAASHRGRYDEETKKPRLLPSRDVSESAPVPDQFKDMRTELKRVEAVAKVTEILISDAEGEEEVDEFLPDGAKEEADEDGEVLAEAAAAAPGPGGHHQFAGEDEDGAKKIGFSIGSLRVHGAGALCSFGVAAATFCIFLLGGKQQHRCQDHKFQLQMYADDQRIQRVMQQASRLNQTVSSVIGGAGASSPRASISFGGHYHGF